MITKTNLRRMETSILKSELKRLVAVSKRIHGQYRANDLIHLWGGEIGQIEKELLRRQPKTLYVSWDQDGDAGYKFELETSKGRRRVMPKGCRAGEEVCLESAQLRAWFQQQGITHVDSKFGETEESDECIKDGKYTAARYIKWWNREEDNED